MESKKIDGATKKRKKKVKYTKSERVANEGEGIAPGHTGALKLSPTMCTGQMFASNHHLNDVSFWNGLGPDLQKILGQTQDKVWLRKS